MSDVYKNLSNASSGKELVDLINGLGLETIIAELSGIEAATIVERFKADADFNNFVGEVTTNAALVPAAPVPVSSLVSVPGSDIDFSRMVSAANGAELVGLFGNGDLATITAGLSPEQIEQVVQKFGADDDFNAWLTTVAPPPPPAGPGADVPPPMPGSGIDFSRMVNATNGAELVGLFGNGDLATITAGLSPEQIEQVVQKFGADDDFNAWLTTVAPPPPPAGPGAYVSPPLPTGAELDELVDQAQNSGQGPLITDSKGQILNQYGEIMVLDSSGNLAPAPRDVPIGMLPDGNGSFMPDPDWMPPSMPGSGIDFSRMVNATNGAELVGLFGNGDLATITAGLSPEQIEQVVQKFGADDDFNAWLTTVAPPPPPAGPGADVPPPSPTQLLNEDGEIMMEDGSGNLVVEPRDVLDLLGLDPVAFVPPPLPAGEELDKLVDQAQNSGQGPLIKDSKGQLLNQYGEVMVLDSGGKLAPAPREVPVGMLPNGDGSFMPDPDWMPLNPLPEEGYFDPRERPPEEGYFDPEGGEYNVDIVGQYSEPPLAHQNWA